MLGTMLDAGDCYNLFQKYLSSIYYVRHCSKAFSNEQDKISAIIRLLYLQVHETWDQHLFSEVGTKPTINGANDHKPLIRY